MTHYDKHPRNENFSWSYRRGPYRLLTEQQANDWNEKGFFLLKNVIKEETILRLVSEMDPLEERTERFLRQQENGRMSIARAGEITFTTHIVKSSEFVKSFLKSTLFVDLCLDLLGENCRLYWDQAVYKKPGTVKDFPWHQDNGYTFVQPQDYLTCWIPLTSATMENGCPWVVPEVHKQGTLDHWPTDTGFQCFKDPENEIAVEAHPGDIVVFSSLTPHRTGANQTDSVRKAYIAQFSHDGSVMYPREGRQKLRQDSEDRQFLIVKNGRSADEQ